MAKKKSPFDVVQKRPNRSAVVEGLNHQGLLLLQQGQFQAGADLLAQSLAHNPHQPEVYYNFGFALQQLGLLDSAIQAYGQAIALSPNDADALMSLGHVLATQQRYAEAAANFARAVKCVPHNADAWNNYGNVLLELAQEPEAIEAYDKALNIRPSFAQALFNKGKALGALERYAEAAQVYTAALKINPIYEEAKWHLSWVTLVLGDFAAGWSLFEARWTVPALGNKRRYPQLPQWLGQAPLAGKNILLYAEQGLGDTLQFCRYVPMLQAMGAQVFLAVQAPLVPLLAEQWTGVTVAASFTDLSQFDWATPLISLPLALGTTLATVPADVPYIRIPELGHSVTNNRPRVGLVWSGSTAHKNDKNRSMPLATLAPLFELPVDWVCLNPELRDTDTAWLAQNPQAVLERPVLTDFAETARVIAQLDLVITVDTSVAHLAGAMAKPVWILLPTGPDYRWLLEREDSPWYPTARLFRQTERGDWSGVVSRVANELKRFSAPRTDTLI